ncbi:glycosyltransferase [Chloroflexota bacterium]
MLSVHSCPLGRLGGKNTGGMSVYIRELARELGKWGHTVDVYTRAHGHEYKPIVEIGQNVRLIHLKAGKDREMDKLEIYPHLADFACELEGFCRDNQLQYDVIHSHYWLSGLVGKWVQPQWDIPHMVMFHTLGAVKNSIGIGEDEPELRITSEREIGAECHRVIAATEKEEEELHQLYRVCRENIRIIPCGVNLELFRPIDREVARRRLGLNGKSIILFVGRVDPLKGIDKLLMGMAYFQQEQRPGLMVVGGDECNQAEVKRLKSLSQSLHIEDWVTFLGTVEQEMLPYYYSAADTCVVPSYYESFGLVALESLACGTPVLATNVGAVESVIRQGENGYMVADNAPRRLTEKIAQLLSMASQRPLSTSFIRESVVRFGWSNVAEALIEEYRAVIRDYQAGYAR